MGNSFNLPFFDQAKSGAPPQPLIPVMPSTNSGTMQPPDGQGVSELAQPLQTMNPDGGTFGLGSSV